MNKERLMGAVIPALLIHCSIGTVYCWSTVKEAVAEAISMPLSYVGWAFSIAIFFLGISAAFFGPLIEKNIGISCYISTICFYAGLVGTGCTLRYMTGVPALLLIYLFYGCIMGIGLGVGYLTPVKNLMLWFSDKKGFATGISIMGFGLAKTIATPVMAFLQTKCGIADMFIYLGFVYAMMMLAALGLIRRPDWYYANGSDKAETVADFNVKELIRDRRFVLIWLLFYINIHCGLMLISNEKQVLRDFGCSEWLLIVIPSVTAIYNAFGRLALSWVSDMLRLRMTMYRVIFFVCTFVCVLVVALSLSGVGILGEIGVVMLLIIVNTGYGGGFSVLPAMLSQYFGMENISKIHGLALTAWAAAGITGNNMASFLLGRGNFNTVILVAALMYGLAYYVSLSRRFEQ